MSLAPLGVGAPSDASVLRAELKLWEREFRAKHARDPTLDDIRLHAAIATKYKLYQKSKGPAALPNRTQSLLLIPPRTPAAQPAPFILRKSQVVKSDTPLPVSNPFSPVKKKPLKNLLTPDQDEFPPHTHSPSPSDGVSKARKRLRGEPVSPSPKGNEKRRRINWKRSALPLFRRRSHSPDESEHTGVVENHSTHFVMDTPVKSSGRTKSFRTLFEGLVESNNGAPVTTTSTSSRPFAAGKAFSETTRDHVQRRTDSPHGDSKERVAYAQARKSAVSTAAVDSEHRPSGKRALENTETFAAPRIHGGQTIEPRSLLPPSPPRDGKLHELAKRGRRKNGQPPDRKRPKHSHSNEEESTDGDATSDEEVKDLGWSMGLRSTPMPHGMREDPEDFLAPPRRPRSPHPAPEFEDNSRNESPGDYFVDLPDELQRVLAMSPTRRHVAESDELVHGLIYGGRDPRYRGEVWDVGETQGTLPTDEDDWEGEGVPWEVGDL